MLSEITICSIEGCVRQVYARTWCRMHYSRWYQQGSPLISLHRKESLVGQRFGRLVVISQAWHQRPRPTRWLCRCDCGQTCIVTRRHLIIGGTRSCGCLKREVSQHNPIMLRGTHHGRSTSEYRIWQGIIVRCTNPKAINFRNYGGRGISICAGWRQEFASFWADLGKRPVDRALNGRYLYSIDRIDNDGNYSCGHCDECLSHHWPMNCRWATRSEQQANRHRVSPVVREVAAKHGENHDEKV